MNIQEEDVLKKYKAPESYIDFFRPAERYTEICFKLGEEYHQAIISGNKLPSDANEIFAKNETSYINMLGKVLTVFEQEVKKGKIGNNQFPIKEWKYLSNRDETRFLMRDFYKLYALTSESLIKNDADYLVYPLSSLNAEEHSKVLGNLSNPQTFLKFIKSISKINPEILNDKSFNPLESMVNEGNPEFLKIALNDSRIQDMVKEGKIRPIEKIEIDGDLIKRLGSTFDNEKKKNIINSLKVLSEHDLLNKQLNDLNSKNKNDYMLFSQIQPADKLSYSDIYLYSNNSVSLFIDNNDKLVEAFKLQEEKRSYQPVSRNRMNY